jgi:hypothetical protein
MSPPPPLNYDKALPPMPATAPVKKHVNFSNSTLQRAGDDDIGKSPSPVKFRVASEAPSGAVVYPTLASVQYPDIAQDAESPPASPSRRLTFGGATPNHPRSFSFESSKAVDFGKFDYPSKSRVVFEHELLTNHLGPVSTGTIRMVRNSDALSLADGKKRKLDTVQESSDKENDGSILNEYRSAKKIKPTPASPSKTPSGSSKLLRRTPGRGSAISKSRLNFLATPKRGKA